MKTEVKSALILGTIIVVGVGILSIVFSTLDETTTEKINSDISELDKSKFKKAPKLVGIEHYLNTTPEKLNLEMEDKVVLYDIWTYSCVNCIRTLPYITTWNEKYEDQGLVVIGIHSPEFEFEKDSKNVEMAMEKHEIKYPVVLDNNMETWKAFENRYWPRKYIADHEGYIRYDHIGEGGYKETEKIIQQLLDERSTALGIQLKSSKHLVELEEFEHTMFRTPELYFGYKFAENRNQLGSKEGFQPEKIVNYSENENTDLHKFYLTGDWKNHKDSMELISDTGTIKLLYNAKEVNIVSDNKAHLKIFLDEKLVSEKMHGSSMNLESSVNTSKPDLYNIISDEESSSHLMELKIKGKGFHIFTFTFG
ncbi:MAG: Thiol-disulfide oxidoreductase ResA [Nitrosopumilus sp.]|nr:Thiol-disulfide oxidoreductase ResA [Nitrosopumilus sp.]